MKPSAWSASRAAQRLRSTPAAVIVHAAGAQMGGAARVPAGGPRRRCGLHRTRGRAGHRRPAAGSPSLAAGPGAALPRPWGVPPAPAGHWVRGRWRAAVDVAAQRPALPRDRGRGKTPWSTVLRFFFSPLRRGGTAGRPPVGNSASVWPSTAMAERLAAGSRRAKAARIVVLTSSCEGRPAPRLPRGEPTIIPCPGPFAPGKQMTQRIIALPAALGRSRCRTLRSGCGRWWQRVKSAPGLRRPSEDRLVGRLSFNGCASCGEQPRHRLPDGPGVVRLLARRGACQRAAGHRPRHRPKPGGRGPGAVRPHPGPRLAAARRPAALTASYAQPAPFDPDRYFGGLLGCPDDQPGPAHIRPVIIRRRAASGERRRAHAERGAEYPPLPGLGRVGDQVIVVDSCSAHYTVSARPGSRSRGGGAAVDGVLGAARVRAPAAARPARLGVLRGCRRVGVPAARR